MDDQTIKVEAVHFDVAADEVAAGGHEVKSETQVEQVFVDCGFENGEEEGADFNESQDGHQATTQCLACPQCDFGCYYEVVLEWHVRVAHLKVEKNSCKICGIPRNSRPSLIAHLKSAHNIPEARLMEPSEGMYQEDPADMSKYICNFCVGYTNQSHDNFDTEEEVIAHIHVSHFGVGAKDYPTPKPCHLCPQCFTSKTEFNSHTSLNSGRHSAFYADGLQDFDHQQQLATDFPADGSYGSEVYYDQSGYEDGMGAVGETSAVDFQGEEDPSQYYEEEGENEYLEPYLTHSGEAPTTSKNLGKQMNILAVPVRPKTQNIRARLTTSVPLTDEIIRQRRVVGHYHGSEYRKLVADRRSRKAVGQGLPFKRSECGGDGGEDGGSDWEEIDGSSVAQTCAMCNQTVIADNTKYVQQHLIYGHGENPPFRRGDQRGIFKCLFCDYLTKYKQNVLKHMKYQHLKLPDPANFACKKCSYSCTYKSQMVTHVKGVHSRIKDWHCQHCDYSCSAQHTLKSHILQTHSTEKGCVCELCDNNFPHKKPFKEHIEACHPGHQIRHCFQLLPHPVNEGERAGSCKFACATLEHLALHSTQVHGVDLDEGAGNVTISKSRSSGLTYHRAEKRRRVEDSPLGDFLEENERHGIKITSSNGNSSSPPKGLPMSLPPGLTISRGQPSKIKPASSSTKVKAEPDVIDLD